MTKTPQHRVGLGEDLHRLVEGRPLLLGGIRLDHDRGLAGHSDGDVVLHAIADALLGAAALGDIGDHFPDTDPAWRDADSAGLLARVVSRVREAGWIPCNLDVVVHAQAPRLGAAKESMRDRIGDLVGLPAEHVNVKAKTGEGLDAIGRGDAIGCRAVVLLVESR